MVCHAAVDGVLEVQNLNSNVESLLGCREAFTCEGVGNAVEWELKIGGARFRNASANMVTVSTYMDVFNMDPLCEYECTCAWA